MSRRPLVLVLGLALAGCGRGDDERAVDAAVGRADIVSTQVFGLSAKVDLADGKSVFLEETPAGWRVSAAGCTPVGGDEPYECEVEP